MLLAPPAKQYLAEKPRDQVSKEDPQTPRSSPEGGIQVQGERKDRHLRVSATKEGSEED